MDPKATSIFWIFGAVVADLVSSVLSIPSQAEPLSTLLISWSELASFACFVVGIYIIRAELMKNYSQREYFPMDLGPFLTFFFSFIYFQYHLFDIADYKLRERMSIAH